MTETLLATFAERAPRAGSGAAGFNPFDLLVRREMHLSQLIGWLLDPRGTHRMGTAPLEAFLALVDLPAGQLERSKVQLEQPVGSGASGGRVDILVRHPAWTIALENKPWARFSDGQLARYTKALSGSARGLRVVALLGAGWSDGELQALRTQEAAHCLRLGSDVQQWVATCAAGASDPAVQTFLTQFEGHLGRTFGNGDDMMQDLEPIFRTPEALSAAVAIIEARPAMAREMGKRFGQAVRGRAETHGFRVTLEEGELPLFGPARYGLMRIDVGDPTWDFAISSEGPYFSQVAWGIAVKSAAVVRKKLYDPFVVHLDRQLGTGQQRTDSWPWWDWIATLDTSLSRTASAPALWSWAADEGEDGLAATLVTQAVEVRQVLSSFVAA